MEVILLKSKRIARVSKDCVACGTCLKECRLGAIEIYKGIRAEVKDNCVGCGKCTLVCPCCVIELIERGEVNE